MPPPSWRLKHHGKYGSTVDGAVKNQLVQISPSARRVTTELACD